MRHLYLLAAAAAGQPTRVWIDGDCDGFHDAAAIRSLSKYNVIGASAVFGSTTVVEAQRKCAAMLHHSNIDVEVSAGASHYEDTQAANAAVAQMTHELAKAVKDNEKMTIVSLGTLTNVAALAVRRPDLAESLHVVITCSMNDPQDICVATDWQALAALLRSPADMTMAPPAPPAVARCSAVRRRSRRKPPAPFRHGSGRASRAATRPSPPPPPRRPSGRASARAVHASARVS